MKNLLLILFCLLCCPTVKAEVAWFDGTTPVTYQVDGKVDAVVQIALRMFCNDMELVTGHKAVESKNAVIHIVQGKGSDDGFRIFVKDGQVVVEGHNARGTAYGLLELSRMAGVSPWVWWGDVRPESLHRLSLPESFFYEHTPSVAYRGIFINDEDWSLRRWSKANMGPQTYKRLFELMLRLRANTLWPAMHEGTPGFFTVKGNKEMADSFGIVIGTSHCEPLLRNNVAEWDVKERGAYNYITNREQVQQYWTERLKQVKGSEKLFTLGMRGIHDGSMEGVKTKEEKLRGLQQVIDDQRQLLRKFYSKKVEQVPQVFIPYKEVLEIMESGLKVPDDVTLMWCDDNYGYLTRLPDAEQQQRKGGGGVYYHLSYWGRPHDYLWLTTTQPGLIYSEMKEAYDHNCRRLWIANVHDPKIAAYDLELFLDMAWDINAIQPQTISQHLENWLCTQFGALVGKAIAPAMREWYRLNAIRRPEFMGWTQVELDKKRYPGGKSIPTTTEFTMIEAYERMEAFARIEATVETYRPLVMEGRQDAYFAHVLYPVHAAAAMSRKMLAHEEEGRRAYKEIQRLTEHYNTLNGGKWRGLMSSAPRNLPVFGEVRTMLPQHPSMDRFISKNACDYQQGKGTTIQMLGHSMNAVSISKDKELVYEFESIYEGDAVLYTAMIPTHPNDKGDLRFQVQLDDQQPIVISLKEPYRSEPWKQNVLRCQALKKAPINVSKGQHTLKVKALDNHIIKARVLDADGKAVGTTEGRMPKYTHHTTEEVTLPSVTLTDAHLWSPDSPYLYRADVLVYDGAMLVDSVREQFGVRTLEFSPEYGFKLNGKKIFLQGNAGHHDLGALGAAAYDRAIERMMLQLKAFGYNTIRCSHNPYSESFTRIADRVGMLVVDELTDKWNGYWGGRQPLLFLNGKSLGVKLNDGKGSMQHVITWDVDYQPGTILAVARNNEGKEVARHDLQTAGKAVKLKIEEEVSEWKSDGMDLHYLNVFAVDNKGRIVPDYDCELSVNVSGPATLLALDNGDHYTDDLFAGIAKKQMRSGKMQIILRSKREAGQVTVSAVSNNFKAKYKTMTK